VFGDGGGYALGGDLGGLAAWFTHRDPQQSTAQPAGAGHAGTDAAHGGAAGHGAAGAAGAAGSQGAAGHPGGEHGAREVDVDDLDMDELATRLFDRLRTRLRREFLIDRERAGLLTDFR